MQTRTQTPGEERVGREAVMAFGVAPVRQPLRSWEEQRAPIAVAREIDQSAVARCYWASAIAVIFWSITYLIRQPGIATSVTSEPFSLLGSFALEGMVLSLAWLALLVAACIAVLSGAAQIEDRSKW